MKAYTNLEQSRKLAEILPLESADYYHAPDADCVVTVPYITKSDTETLIPAYKGAVPCWSLAALLNYLREIDFFPTIEADEHSVTMSVCYYDEEEGRLLNPIHDINIKAETFIDACYELICKLHEQNII